MEEPKYDGSAALIQGQLMSLAEDFDDIRKGSKGVSDENFNRAVKFAWLISEGMPKSKAYCETFEVAETKHTRALASSLMRKKYVGDIINRMIAGNHVLMADKHVQVLNEMFDIGMDKSVSDRNRIDVLDKFAQLTKKPEAIKIDYDVTIGLGAEMAEKIDSLTANLAAKGSMIGSDGQIIDVVVLD